MKASKSWWWLGVLIWMGIIWYLSDQPNLSSGLEQDWWLRKLAHLVEYAILAILLILALGGRGVSYIKVSFALLVAILFAMSDEWHQTQVVGRNGAVRDVVIDSIGALIGVILMHKKRITTENKRPPV